MESRLEVLSADNMMTALDMCDRFVSPGLYTLASLGDIAEDPGHDFYLVKEGDSYLGYFYAQRLKAKDIGRVPGFHYGLIAPSVTQVRTSGSFARQAWSPNAGAGACQMPWSSTSRRPTKINTGYHCFLSPPGGRGLCAGGKTAGA